MSDCSILWCSQPQSRSPFSHLNVRSLIPFRQTSFLLAGESGLLATSLSREVSPQRGIGDSKNLLPLAAMSRPRRASLPPDFKVESFQGTAAGPSSSTTFLSSSRPPAQQGEPSAATTFAKSAGQSVGTTVGKNLATEALSCLC